MQEELDPSLALWLSWESLSQQPGTDSGGTAAYTVHHAEVDEVHHKTDTATRPPTSSIRIPANSPATPPIHRLPNEILDAIIRQIPHCHEICLHVCRRWRAVTLPLRFRTLVISRDRMLRHPDWLSFWTESPWLAVHVRVARLSHCTMTLKELDMLLSCLPSLDSLELEQPSISRAIGIYHVAGYSHTLRDLQFVSHREFWFDDLADILGLFSEIDSFYASPPQFTSAVTRRVSASNSAGHRGKLQIHKIRSSNVQPYSGLIFPMPVFMIARFLTEIDAFRSLTSMAVSVGTSDPAGLAALLCTTGKTLKSLTLSISHYCDPTLSDNFDYLFGSYDHTTDIIALHPLTRLLMTERHSFVSQARAGLVACVHLEDIKLIVHGDVFVEEGQVTSLDLKNKTYLHIWHVAVEVMRIVPRKRLRTLGLEVVSYFSVADPESLPWGEVRAICRSLRHLQSVDLEMGSMEVQRCAARELREFENVHCKYYDYSHLTPYKPLRITFG